jgi:hypothetical protein
VVPSLIRKHRGRGSDFDPEHFRSAPRTCGPDYGRLELRKTGHGPVGGAALSISVPLTLQASANEVIE